MKLPAAATWHSVKENRRGFGYTANTMSDRAPTAPNLTATLTALCRDVEEDIARDFVSRMDPDYFIHVEIDRAAQHLRLIAALTLDHPCELSIRPQEGGRFQMTVVAYDYFSEFATICGLLSAFGLNIEEGRIYTFAEATSSAGKPFTAPWPIRRLKDRPGLSRKKIVDVFLVHPVSGEHFTAREQEALRHALAQMIQLLDAGKFEEARQSYEKALKLDPKNLLIRQNYDLFKEINDRAKRRNTR